MHSTRPSQWLNDAAAGAPNRPALVLDGVAMSYAELDDLAARTAAALAPMLELGPGARLGVAATGRRPLSTIGAMWGAWRLGAAVMPLDPRLPELRSGSAGMKERHRLAEIVTHVDAAASPWQGRVAPSDGDLHSLVMTSGAGRERRAVMLTHGNVAAAVEASQQRLGNGPDDRWLLCLPMFHIAGLSILWRSARSGGSVVVQTRFDAAAAADGLRSGAVTMASFVPAMLQRVLDADAGPYHGVKAVLVGGAAVTADLVRRGLDAGLPVLATYGMTETASQITTVVPGTQRDSLGTVGIPLPGMEVSTDAGGVITVDGPAVSPGFDGEPARSGPLRTNDVGFFDGEGRLIVLGRRDHVIIRGGENVHPDRVEEALLSHPSVVECVVYGLQDDELGEVVAATVVVPADLQLTSLAEHVAQRLAPFEVPTAWRRVDSVPVLASGKPDRRAARIAHEGAWR